MKCSRCGSSPKYCKCTSSKMSSKRRNTNKNTKMQKDILRAVKAATTTTSRKDLWAGKRITAAPVVRYSEPPATRGMHDNPVAPQGKGVCWSALSAVTPGGSAMTFSTTPDIRCVNALGIGVGNFQRDGQRIEMKSFRIVGQARINPSIGVVSELATYGRIMLVYDRQPVGSLPSLIDIIGDVDTAGTYSVNAFSGISLRNRDRFAMIIDKRIYFPAITTNSGDVSTTTGVWPSAPGDDSTILIDEFRLMKNLETRFLDTASSPPAIGDITTGALYLITVSNDSGATPGFVFAWNARLRYTDQ